MVMFKKYIKMVLKDIQKESINEAMPANAIVGKDTSYRIENEEAFRFHIHPAHGGKIVEVHQYQQGKHRQNLYIIRTEDDLGDQLAKIITMECLR